MLRESHRLGIEPATCKSQVQRPTAEPPRCDVQRGILYVKINIRFIKISQVTLVVAGDPNPRTPLASYAHSCV